MHILKCVLKFITPNINKFIFIFPTNPVLSINVWCSCCVSFIRFGEELLVFVLPYPQKYINI